MTPDREQLRQQIADALHGAGAYCGECNFEDDSKTCPECIKVRGWYVDAVLPVLDAAVAAAVRGALEGAGRTLSAIEEDSHAAAVVQYLATPYTDDTAVAAPAREQGEEQPDTLPAWLYQRFGKYPIGVDWNELPETDQAYWTHEAAAVRRAVNRGGFKSPEATR